MWTWICFIFYMLSEHYLHLFGTCQINHIDLFLFGWIWKHLVGVWNKHSSGRHGSLKPARGGASGFSFGQPKSPAGSARNMKNFLNFVHTSYCTSTEHLTCWKIVTGNFQFQLAKSHGNVFATDAIIATLMCCARSVYSWDVIVQRVGKKLFFDKRDGSEFGKVSVLRRFKNISMIVL